MTFLIYSNDRDGQGELLSQEAADEAPTTDFATVFEAAEGDQHFAPFGQDGFSAEHFAGKTMP